MWAKKKCNPPGGFLGHSLQEVWGIGGNEKIQVTRHRVVLSSHVSHHLHICLSPTMVFTYYIFSTHFFTFLLIFFSLFSSQYSFLFELN